VTLYRSEQCLDDGSEALLVLSGVPQQSGSDQDVVRMELPDLLSLDWDLGDPQVERLSFPRPGTFHVSD